MEKSVIKFSDDETSFIVSFKNGKETCDIVSKKEGLIAVQKFFDDKKITQEEFLEMVDQIIKGKKIPWVENFNIRVSVGVIDLGVLEPSDLENLKDFFREGKEAQDFFEFLKKRGSKKEEEKVRS